MKHTVISAQGRETDREIVLPKEIFGIEPNKHIVYLDVKNIQANKRQGTHKAKEKGEITASTRKIKRQKGTGTARAGSIKSPIFRGGGRVFGPRVRSYGGKMNKNEKLLARRSVLSHKAQKKEILILENFSLDAPKTKEYMKMLSALNLVEEKTLLVIAEPNSHLFLAARNISKAQVATVDSLNTYDLLHAKKLLINESALPLLVESLK